jgi:hypothetical protein
VWERATSRLAGADVLKVMDLTRHRRVETLKGCDRRAKAFRNQAGDGFLRRRNGPTNINPVQRAPRAPASLPATRR